MSNFIKIFNNNFFEFIDFVIYIFPDNIDLLTAKNSMLLLKKQNPKLIFKIWNEYVVKPYRTEIENGDFTFFINKDYSIDLIHTDNSTKIINFINNLRHSIKEMTDENKTKTIKYVQNLLLLSIKFDEFNN